MDTLLIISLCLIIISIIFVWIGNSVEDNYSIENLIGYFGLYRGDTLDFDLKINKDLNYEECVISGEYSNGILKINPLKNAGKKNKKLCEEIIEGTELKFIGDIENPSMDGNSKEL